MNAADTLAAWTIAAPALAWSECDDEPYCLDYLDETDDDGERSSR